MLNLKLMKRVFDCYRMIIIMLHRQYGVVTFVFSALLTSPGE